MRVSLTTLCLVLTIVSIAQPKKKMTSRDSILVEYHHNQGDPVFNPEPILLIPENTYGWTKSIDDKWLIETNRLPIYRMSSDLKSANSKEAEIGEDNFKHMAFYEMDIDTNRFLVYVKQYSMGGYEYPITKSGWKTKNVLYYAVIARPTATDSLKSIEIDTNLNFGFRILDEKLISDVPNKAYKNPWKYISEKLLLERTDRKLVVQLEKKDQGQLRFLVYSIHPVFHDPVSLSKDWKELNRSIYADKETLHRLHYTILESEWSQTILP